MTARAQGLLHAALRAAGSGLYVFPVVPRSKVPAITDWERRATRDRRQITAWWGRSRHVGANIGAAVGRSGLVVVDLDVARDDQPPPEFAGATCGRDVLAMLAERGGHASPFQTRTVSTPSGGRHLYYRAPAGIGLRNSCAALGWCIDTRGCGGFVVAAGSLGRHGRYRVTNPAPVADLPDWLRDSLAPPQPAPRSTASGWAPRAAKRAGRPRARLAHPDRPAAYMAAIIERETADLANAVVGTRHHARLAAARTLGRLVGGGELTEHQALTLLWQAAQRHIGHDCTEREVARDLRDGLAFGQRLPRRLTGCDQRH